MNEKFRQHVEALHPALERLEQATPFKYADLASQRLPQRGIYLFSEGCKYLYVGRSDDISRRIQLHCRQGSTHNQATFAFRLAKELCGIGKASYKPEGSRADLVSRGPLKSAFLAQKKRLQLMDIRIVEESDANRRAYPEFCV